MLSGTDLRRAMIAVVCCALAACGARASEPGAQRAAPPEKASGASIGGSAWEGVVELPTNMRLNFRAQFAPAGEGGLSGTIDIPMQELHGVSLRDVVREGDVLRFTFGPPGMPPAAWAMFEVTLDGEGKSASGHMQQHGQKFPVKMSRAAAGEGAAKPARPQEPRPPFPYTMRELSLVNPRDGTRLVGTLTIPGKARGEELVTSTKHPAVVLITGSGPQDRDETIFGHKPFAVLADHLARHGIASLRCDDRGVGASTGDLMKATAEDLASDVSAAVAILRRQPDIDPTRIGLIGHSEGGTIAPMVASDDPTIRYIVLLAATGLPGTEILRTQSIALLRASGVAQEAIERQMDLHARMLALALNPGADRAELLSVMKDLVRLQMASAPGGGPALTDEQLAQAVEQHVGLVTSPWFRSFGAYDPRPALRRVRCAVLALNGSLDLQVLPKENLGAIGGALEEGGNKNVEIAEMDGLNHMFQPAATGAIEEYGLIETTMSPEVLARISSWIRSKTGLPNEAAEGAGPAGTK